MFHVQLAIDSGSKSLAFYSRSLVSSSAYFSSQHNLSTISEERNLHISKECAERLKQITDSDQFLRVQVDGGGCQGFTYKFSLENKLNDSDLIFEKDGCKVVVDQSSLEFLAGSTVDYSQELIRSSFRIVNNPKAVAGCSCGASFSISSD